MKIPSAPPVVRSALEWLLDPDRLVAGSVVVLLLSAAVSISLRTGVVEHKGRFPLPSAGILAIRSAEPLDANSWRTVVDNFLPTDSLDLFASGSIEAVFDVTGPVPAEILILDDGQGTRFAALAIPRDEGADTDPYLERAVAAFLAPRHPLVREVRLPDGTRYREVVQDPALFPFETTEVSGRSIRELKLPGEGIAYARAGGTTIIASSAERLALAFHGPEPRTLSLCQPGDGLVVTLRRDSWVVSPTGPTLTRNPLPLGPPTIYLPMTVARVTTPSGTLTLPVCRIK